MSTMANKATSGPWRVGDAGATVFGPNKGELSPETIATLTRGVPSSQRKANAHLIAAAPELVASLTTLLAAFRNKEYIGFDCDRGGIDLAIDTARALLARIGEG